MLNIDWTVSASNVTFCNGVQDLDSILLIFNFMKSVEGKSLNSKQYKHIEFPASLSM
jgi:hypothetical protein